MVKVKNKYITQKIQQLNNLNLIIKNETTELTVELNHVMGQNIFLDLSSFTNLKKLSIIDDNNGQKFGCRKYWSHWISKNVIMDKGKKSLNIISSTISKLYCISANISYITNLPSTLKHLKCSSNDIMEIKYLPPTLEILELSECRLGANKFSLMSSHLPNLKILKINSNNLCLSIDDFIPLLNNLNIFECVDNQLSNFSLLANIMPNLKILKCSNNLLTDDSFTNLPPGLEILICSHNSIKRLENIPLGIKILDCSYNKIEELDYLPSGIEKLICSHNRITRLDNLPSTIKHLIIISNPIIELENLPSCMTELKIAKCDKFINKIVNPPENMEKVVIINNNIKTLGAGDNFVNLVNLPNAKSIIVKDCYHGGDENYAHTKNLI